jgi:CHAD domain-containing protein
MKAKKVKRLDVDATFAEGAQRIAKTRIAELWSFADAALDPGNGEDQHDMRIAAKRLRYLLELSAPCIGKPARDGAKVARELQDVLGEIHDCEVFIERLEQHVEDLRAADVDGAVRAAGARATDLDPGLMNGDSATKYRGLERAIAYYEARRLVLHRRFVRRWARLDANHYRERLEEALAAS